MSDDNDKKNKADEIITNMTDKNPSDQEAIKIQKKVNKELLGHEGEFNPDKH